MAESSGAKSSSGQRPSTRSQATIQTAGRLIGTAAQAVAFALLARSVAPTTFGEIAVVNGSTTFISALLDFGLPSYISKQRALGRDNKVLAAVHINTASTIGLGIVTCLIVQLVPGIGLPGFTAMLISLANTVDKNVETLLAIPLSDGATRYSAVSFLLRRLSWLVLFVLLKTLGVDSVWAFCVSWLASDLLGQAHARKITAGMMRGEQEASPWLEILRETFPFYLTAVSSQVRLLDTTAVSAIAGAAQAGLYSAASKLVAPFLLIPGTLTSLVLPNALRRSNDDRIKFAKWVLGAAFTFAAVGLALYPAEKWVLGVVLGRSYIPAATAFCFSLAAAPFIAATIPLGALLAAADRERLMAGLGMGGGVLTLVFLIAGAAVDRAAGAAIGLGAASLIQSLLSLFFLQGDHRKVRNFDVGPVVPATSRPGSGDG